MKLLEIDWLDFIARAETWRRLAPSTRHALLRLGRQEEIHGKLLAPDLDLLQRERFTAAGRGWTVVIDPAARPFLRALRAMHRFDLLNQPREENLARYIGENLTGNERLRLGRYRDDASPWVLARRAGSAEWVRSLLSPTRAARDFRWIELRSSDTQLRLEVRRSDAAGSPSGRNGGPALVEAIRALLEALKEADEPVPFPDLPPLVPDLERRLFGQAVLEAVRYLLVFPGVDGDDAVTPVLGLWPAAHARLRRPPAPAPQPLDAPPPMAFGAPYLLEDMTTALAAAGADPLPVRQQDFGLYARTAERIAADLMPLPDWLVALTEDTPEERVQQAVLLLRLVRFLAAAEGGTSTRRVRLEPTEEGRRWLAGTTAQRLKAILDEFREDARLLREDGASRRHGPRPCFVPPIGVPLGDRVELRVVDALERVFGQLPEDRFIRLHSFFDHALTTANPLLADDDGNVPSIGYGWGGTEEQREQLWKVAIDAFLVPRLLHFGGIRLGVESDGRVVFALTSVGRYLCGAADTFELEPPAAEAAGVLIQPNFEVVFLAPAPRLEAGLARFAERLGSGVGTLFRLTRASILAAAGAGLSAEQVLETLRAAASQPLPANVEREVTSWFEQARRARLRPATLIECPDIETAARVVDALGARVRRLAPTVLELQDRLPPAAVRKLNRAGVFLDEVAHPERRASRPRRRGRR